MNEERERETEQERRSESKEGEKVRFTNTWLDNGSFPCPVWELRSELVPPGCLLEPGTLNEKPGGRKWFGWDVASL